MPFFIVTIPNWAEIGHKPNLAERLCLLCPPSAWFQGMVWFWFNQDPSRPVRDCIGFIGWHLRKRSSKFMDVYGVLWMFMDVYGVLWMFMDVYGVLWMFMVFYRSKEKFKVTEDMIQHPWQSKRQFRIKSIHLQNYCPAVNVGFVPNHA